MNEKEITEELNFLKEQPKIDREGNFDSKDATEVLMCEAKYTCSFSPTPILGSLGAGPCLIVAVYDRRNERAILTHLSSSATPKHYEPLFNWATNSKIETHLYGGASYSFKSINLVAEITRYIRNNPNIEIMSANIAPIVNGDPVSSSLAIDSRSGEIFTKFSFDRLVSSKDHRDRDDRQVEGRLKFFSEEFSPLDWIQPLPGCEVNHKNMIGEEKIDTSKQQSLDTKERQSQGRVGSDKDRCSIGKLVSDVNAGDLPNLVSNSIFCQSGITKQERNENTCTSSFSRIINWQQQEEPEPLSVAQEEKGSKEQEKKEEESSGDEQEEQGDKMKLAMG